MVFAADVALKLLVEPEEDIVIIKVDSNVDNVTYSDSGSVLNIFTVHADLAAVLAEVGAIYRIRLGSQNHIVLNGKVKICNS